MRNIQLEKPEPLVMSKEWWEKAYPLRSKVEITILAWPRRQRFGRITYVYPNVPYSHRGYPPHVCPTANIRVALPMRLELTQKAERDYWMNFNYYHEYSKARCLDDEMMAYISDDEELCEYGFDLFYSDVKVIGPPLPRLAAQGRQVRL